MSDMTAMAAPAQHPISLQITDDLRRTRLTAFFRLILAIPHIIWALLLGILAVLAVIGNWFATLVQGRSPEGLHGFIAGYLRYTTHVSAYLWLIADPFPGFFMVNLKEDYPVDLEVAPPEVQNRWTVAFRLILAFPAMIIVQILRNISTVLAVFSWVMAVLTARVPQGLRNFSAFALRYETQTYAYLGILTQRYPSFDVGITA
jgi:Domain of unknown function (DUF4389)